MSQAFESHTAPIAELIPGLDRLAADAMADWKVPGAALAIVQDGKVALVKAYGLRDVEANLPMTPSTQFDTGSITKSFTATAIALLHDEGRLDWTKPVRDYLPEFRLKEPGAADRVTVRDLLCHQTGLPRHDWMWMPGDLTAAELLGPMRYLEPSSDIRAAFQYNNLGYNVLGLLIERVSSEYYASFVRSRLTNRLGMSVSFTLEELEAAPEAAKPYLIYEDERRPAFRWPTQDIADGGLNTSAADFAHWMKLHLGKGEFEGKRLLPAALIAELHAPRIYTGSPGEVELGESHYGFGFGTGSYRGDRVVSHGGAMSGWNTLMTLLPDFGLGVAVFTNCNHSMVPQILTWYIADRLRGRDLVDWRERYRKRRNESLTQMQIDKNAKAEARHKGTRPAHELADYAGGYEHPAYGVMSIEVEEDALHWSWRGMSANLAHRHYETFELPEAKDRLLPDSLAITFLTGREGNIVSLSAPLEPMVKDIVFTRQPAGECTDADFRARCAGQYKHGAMMLIVTLNPDGQLVLKPDYQPAYRLVALQGRRFQIAGLEGYSVEFRGDAIIEDMILHQPNGTFFAARVKE
ncbi:MAG: serine hydrolase [Rhodomicrobium sp.]